ncbi:hypothetical protein OJ252_3329, partial [Cryptosporidium canis]
MHTGGTGAVHSRWPLCVFVDEKSLLPEVSVVNLDEGRSIQRLEIHGRALPRYVCWHEDLLTLVVGFDDYFEVWTLEHDIRYVRLLDEGIIAPSFDLGYEDYYSGMIEGARHGGHGFQSFGVTDILGSNHRRRLNIFWSERYGSIRLELFKRVDLRVLHNGDAVLKRMSWLDHSKLVIQHSSDSRGTFLTVWRFQFETFNIDVYKEILSRRRLEEAPSAFLNELEDVYIEVLAGVDSKPVLEQELSFVGPRADLHVAFDYSERFIIVYQCLDNELFIWRYEHSEDQDQTHRIAGVFPSQFQFQKISLRQGEEIVHASWKPCLSGTPYKLRRLGGISELSAFSIISRTSEDIIVRIWRESSLNKPCKFTQALYLRFDNRPLVGNEEITLIWESFRDNVTHHLNSLEASGSSIEDLSEELQDPPYYYSTSRYPLIEEDGDDYLYHSTSSYYSEELSVSSIPLNSCNVPNPNRFSNKPKDSK